MNIPLAPNWPEVAGISDVKTKQGGVAGPIANHSVLGTPMQVAASMAPLRRAPSAGAPLETQVLFGEIFIVYEERGGWAWGQTEYDGYVGFMDCAALALPQEEATHRVRVLRTYRYAEPDLKSRPLGLLSMNAKLRVEMAPVGRFVREGRGGWLFANHLMPTLSRVADYVAVAEMFLRSPYLWGGRESLGLDCSALLQNAMEMAGQKIPRDSGPQEKWFKESRAKVLFDRAGGTHDWEILNLQRGDLIFWKGHVAMMVDGQQMIHANATHMCVSIDEARAFAGKVASETGYVKVVLRPKF